MKLIKLWKILPKGGVKQIFSESRLWRRSHGNSIVNILEKNIDFSEKILKNLVKSGVMVRRVTTLEESVFHYTLVLSEHI